MRYFIELSYFGKAYHGWQKQPNAISVQEVLENNLSKMLNTRIEVVGAGRTDSGVHAKQLFAHLDLQDEINTEETTYRLNCMLPKDIVIEEIFKVKNDAHARFDALSRTYEYHLIQKKNVFLSENTYLLKQELNVAAMNSAAQILKTYTNFKCFARSRTDVKTYNCEIVKAEWQYEKEKLVFYITADRFLRNMVRAVVGTLLEIGTGKLKPEAIHEIIKSKDRGRAGTSVPAHGLYLTRIEYPKSIRID